MDLGYTGAAASLSRESGFELESPAVAAFRNAILEGQWTEAEGILLGSHPSDGGGGSSDHAYPAEGLVLAEGADRNEMLFWMRQQKFLELLEQRDLGSALRVLRQELTPLHHDINRLHFLSRSDYLRIAQPVLPLTLHSLLMSPAEDLRREPGWEGDIQESRRNLLAELSSKPSNPSHVRQC